MGSPTRTCSIDGCDRRHEGRGFCTLHLGRWKRWGDPRADLPSRRDPSAKARGCGVEECDGEHYAKGYCRKHHQRLLKYGDPLGLSEWAKGNRDGSAKWQDRRLKVGQVSNAQSGYLKVYVPDSGMANSRGDVLQHRFVMGEHLGRDLLPEETVHHINGDRTDNRIQNLELWVSRHPKGQRVVDLVAFAREVLDRYADDVDQGLI